MLRVSCNISNKCNHRCNKETSPNLLKLPKSPHSKVNINKLNNLDCPCAANHICPSCNGNPMQMQFK